MIESRYHGTGTYVALSFSFFVYQKRDPVAKGGPGVVDTAYIVWVASILG